MVFYSKRGREDEDSVLDDGLDYFEFMTLILTETEVEEYRFDLQPQGLEEEQQKDEEKMPRRVQRRGGGRRGRQQRKDFQRDVLPSLSSLSRYEIIEDIHTIEELFKAAGSTWQSNFSQRGGGKNGRRGRRRLRGGSTLSPSPSPTVTFPPPLQQQQPDRREVGICINSNVVGN